ncbi:NAD-dependent succinate-semialdehyde dehydrogenase [Altererythrobacter sp. FM1]|uniref:NAD-dependent succinate-semialdehyde dehydrogenase n=1 Tax=Tsuneonella flava TaxID=2055955 RepID=A0ABX7KC06_9SPHN|nr:NAD-dependent succinate-semialdehyde dehydrogenase [Tsuneonella flava]QSB44887.1 NAD-dependent succinate-semialdehyde dehydrogenase [Tsuneonella flava]ROT96606.1 NAD-dependent succinate-semialdehyde dehydrogenase [Altererythrobacter sp. FM1]
MITTRNPATGETLAEYEELTARQIDAKIARASATYAEWRTSPVADRSALLERLAEAYDANLDKLARQATLEMGKTLKSARAEVAKCATLFRHLAQTGPAMLEPEEWDLGDGKRARGHWLPQGPVLAVMPWNFPYWQVARFLAPTVLAGNVGLLKHASIVQGCAALIEEMMHEAGAPEGLLQNLCIGSAAVEPIIDDPRVIAVTLTGSEGAGKAVAEAAGRNLKKVVLELGGSDPFIVMPSADLDEAVKQAVAARIQNTGQSCICGKRMIVHSDIYDAFMAKFIEAMQAVVAGDPFDAATEMGPLSSMAQRDTVLDQIATARREGATLEFGGEPTEGPGAYISAGILTGVPLDSSTAQEEIFGPIAQVYRARNIDEAIRIANAIPFGLGSSVWTQDTAEQDRFVRDIEAGMTAINQMLASAPQAPFGGIKRSGHGRELSRHGVHEFMNLKTVMLPG